MDPMTLYAIGTGLSALGGMQNAQASKEMEETKRREEARQFNVSARFKGLNVLQDNYKTALYKALGRLS